MGTINKSGQASIRNGKLGTTTNYSLGSTGTTNYSLNAGGGLVTTQWLIASIPFTQTLIPGDTIAHSWQLGSTGTTEYNMGAGGSKTLKYTLDPGGNITESNGRLSGKTGTASYTLGTGSQSNVTATLGKGSTQSYTVGTGGSATITMDIAGVPTTITLGPGDSSTTTIDEGATAVLESESVYDSDAPPEESMEYDVGDDGSTDNTFGGTVWDVWLFQPYLVNTFPDLRTDYNPICVVMPRGEYNPGCPGVLPSFVQDNGDYEPGTNCRSILIGSATKNEDSGFWDVTQNAIGTLTFATEEKKDSVPPEDAPVAPIEVVNHYQTAVFGYEGFWKLRVGRGGNIWRPVNGNCDKQLRTDVITPSSVVGLNVGTNVDSAWASDDGYVDIYEESDYYVYAYKVEDEEDAYFYIYVTTDGTLDSACPVVLPEEIETPIVTHTVQVVRVAVAYFDEGRWHVSQKVLCSIAWPQNATPGIPPEEYVNQFELKADQVVIGEETFDVLKVANGAHIYRDVSSTCDEMLYTEDITAGTGITVYTSGGAARPWSNSVGWIENTPAVYVYAVRVSTDEASEFYIYASNNATIADVCPVALPSGITAPIGIYTVQALLIGSASYSMGTWTITQNIVGSITWPQNVVTNVEQFKVQVINAGEGWGVQVAKGRVLARCGDFVTDTQSTPTPSFDYVEYVEQCLKEFNVKNFAVYPTGSIVVGADASSPWASSDGYVDVATDHTYGVYLVMNQFDAAGAYTSGAPYLAVIADDDENEALEKSRPYGDNSCDSVKYYTGQLLEEVPAPGPYYLYTITDVSPGYDFDSACTNYNCQRVKIATIQYGGDPAAWTVTQHLIGTLTIPSQFNHMGLKNGYVHDHTGGSAGTWITNPFSAAILFSSQNTAWNGAWTGYDKSFSGATEEIAL